MPTVLFAHDKPRAIHKIGPILKKKGISVLELSHADIGRIAAALGGAKPDAIIVDVGSNSFETVNALKKAEIVGPGRIVVAPPPDSIDEQLPGVSYVHPAKIVDGILRAISGPAQLPASNAGGNQAAAPAASAAPAAATTVEQIISLKTDKIRDLRKRGIDPFPIRFDKKDFVSAILAIGAPLANEQHSGKNLTTAGRVVQLRLMGKAAFFHLQDGTGKAQAYIRLDSIGEQAFSLFKDDVQVGDFVGVSGEVFKTKTGEPSLHVKSLVILAKALRPLPEKWHGLKDTEVRYRQRHLDLIASEEVRRIFQTRSKMISTIRKTFGDLGYMEVETPILLAQAGGATATPFETFHRALGTKLSLRIATELPLKRLICGGFERVFEIGRIFRNEGIDTRHNPEFTTLEAYQAYGDYNSMMDLVERVFSDLSASLGVDSIDYRGAKISLKPPFRKLYMPEMWKSLCGGDIHDILQGKGFNRAGLLALAKKLRIECGDDTPSAKIFERIFDAKLLPELVQPAFVLDHPTAITPLAKCKPGDESLVERFEFFLGTDELANAYSELNDPLDQRERLEEQMRQKAGGHEEADILDEDFVQAMETGMPPMGGIGFGIDRLAMVFTGNPSIREVILFPTLKPEGASDAA